MNSHKYITCTGYGGTGSSVISDLMKEFSNVKSAGNFEFSLAFDIDGISDLQHFVLDDFERTKTVEGIYRFRRHSAITRELIMKETHHDIGPVIEEYLKELINIHWSGSNHQISYRKPKIVRILYNKYYKALWRFQKRYNNNDGFERGIPFPKQTCEISYPVNVFYKATQQLFENILCSFDKDNQYEYLHFDQLVPCYNFSRYINYFPNLKIIVVDRDPRDLYILNKVYWHEGWIPSDDIETYIKWFRLIRNPSQFDSHPNVLKIKFEDTIFSYLSSIERICKFIGIPKESQIRPKQFFNPEISIKNTHLYCNFDSEVKNIVRIEKELEDYCYPF